MSGGPPHHPHNRQVPATNIPNSAWNHLQVPNFFPRQPQLAHMPSEHSILHQPTWHTPTTTEAMKMLPHHPQVFESLFPRDCVDLSLARNGGQNGEPPTPISLSVRDTNKINSLPPGALDIRAVELTKPPAGRTPPVVPKPMPDVAKAAPKRANVRVDSILERLNTMTEKVAVVTAPPEAAEVPTIVQQPAGGFDDNSNSSSILNAPNTKEDDAASSYSNEDSLDSNKSRRKRKPSKTVRVSKEEEKVEAAVAVEPEKDPVRLVGQMLEEVKHPERAEPSSELDELLPAKVRRKTLSESETIDDIAAMVQEGLKEKQRRQLEQVSTQQPKVEEAELEGEKVVVEPAPPPPVAISVSVIKTKEQLAEVLAETEGGGGAVVVGQKNTHFVEVENKLEEMFAGIEDSGEPVKPDPLDLADDPLLKLAEPAVASTSQKSEPVVTSSTEIKKKSAVARKPKRKAPRRGSDAGGDSPESTPTKKKKKAGGGKGAKQLNNNRRATSVGKTEQTQARDVYAYDSGSNASSTRSRGPFVQIRGPRDSPLSVSVVNAPDDGGDDVGERRLPRAKKYHDDSEYRQRVRSKGLHCSTLSTKYDAQTKDASWLCSFCKRGPHASELSGPTSGRETAPPGDLFGPYIISTRCPEFERRLDDPYDKNFRSKKVHRALDEAAASRGKKSKRKTPEEGDAASTSPDAHAPDLLLGITETPGGGYEVWAHEDCVVWSPGVYLVGPKIVGLEEAVWTSCNVACRLCGLRGANVTCSRRGCVDVMHLCCCRSSGWRFVEEEFRAYCPEHHRVP